MAQAILLRSGAGGVTSDDVTASKSQVLQGYRTITSDSDDEVIEGTIVNRGNIVDTVSFENAHWDSKFLARMEEGFYLQNGPWKPCVAIPYAVLSNVIGVDTTKMLQSLTLAGKQGQIKMIDTQTNNYKGNLSTNYGIDTWNNNTFWMDFPHGNAYYYRADGHPHCCIPAEALGDAGADSLLEWTSATSKKGVKFSGAIKRWVCNTGDVISAVNGEGFAWDDSYAGRGRGIVAKIPNNHYIQGANWVFLPSPNLRPENILENVDINGTRGNVPDYRIGRPVFSNATFNATYVGGVANKDFPEAGIYRDRTTTASNYSKYAGGTTINVSAGSNFHLWANGQYVGFVLDRAILFTFFRQLKITYKLDVRMNTGSYNRRAGVDVYVHLYDAANRSSLIGGMHKMHSSSENAGSTYNGDTYEMIVDTSSINRDAFVALCASAYSDYNMSSAIGNVTFTKIELIN
nr:MAG TPA: hypothetical protein [Caudoviricetes sp.]